MSLSFNSSLSGIRAAFTSLSVSANNVANINTDGFKKQVVNLNEGSDGGVVANISESTESGPIHQDENGNLIEGSNVDFAEEAVEQIEAKTLLSANVAVISRSNDTQDSLFDILA